MKLHQRGSLINLKDLITKNEFIIKNEIKRLSAMSEKLFHFLFNPLSTILFDKGGLFAKEELHPLFLIQQSVFLNKKAGAFSYSSSSFFDSASVTWGVLFILLSAITFLNQRRYVTRNMEQLELSCRERQTSHCLPQDV